MNFLILSENTNGIWGSVHYRALAPLELRRRIELRGHKATLIEWMTRWTDEQLRFVAEKVQPDVIAISIPFNPLDIQHHSKFIYWARERFPNIEIILGGVRYHQGFEGLVDKIFMGRSMEIFDAYLDGKDLTPYIQNIPDSEKKPNSPTVLLNNTFNEYIDNPILPSLREEDFYSPRDIVGFELGVGCKFNCTFCNYELRNAKITNLADPNQLYEYFNEANKKFGIKNFYAVDDTLNETDEKLEILASVVDKLDFQPEISSYLRLDLIGGRPQQIDLLKRIQLRSVFFGIESFNPEASKLVRKRSGLYDNLDTLRKLKEACPTMYKVGGLIIGLNGDNYDHIKESAIKALEEGLLDTFRFYPLQISPVPKDHYSWYFGSDIERNPKDFDYRIIEANSEFAIDKHLQETHWVSDWTNTFESRELGARLTKEVLKNKDELIHLEYASMYALGTYDKFSDKHATKETVQVISTSTTISKLLQSNYVEAKLKSFQ